MTFQESDSYFSTISMDKVVSRVLNQSEAFICVIDVQEIKILWANKYFINKVGYSEAVLLNMTPDELMGMVHPDYREFILERLRSIDEWDIEKPYGLFKIKTRNSRYIWVLSTYVCFEKDNCGHTHKILGFASEVNIKLLYAQLNDIHNTNKAENKTCLTKLLSEREITVIELITNGYSDRRISEYLGISIHTAKTHRKRIIHKMGLRNSSALVKYAVENGLCNHEFPAL
jgi:PAS domain S-box-containing protein